MSKSKTTAKKADKKTTAKKPATVKKADTPQVWEEIVDCINSLGGEATRAEILEYLGRDPNSKISGYLKALCEEGTLKRSKEAVYEDSNRKVWVFKVA